MVVGPWIAFLWKLLRNKRFRAWLLATAGPRALALFLVWLERVRHRQVAIGEADQIDGMFSAAIIDGERHVIVWKDGEPISSYPPVEGDLAKKLNRHARKDLTRPDDLPTRRARRWLGGTVGRVRGGAAGVGGETVRHARDGAATVGGGTKRLAREGASAVGTTAREGAQHVLEGVRALRQLAPGGSRDDDPPSDDRDDRPRLEAGPPPAETDRTR